MGNERGSVTILIVLAAGVIMAIGLAFNWLVKEHIRTSEALQDKAEAITVIRSSYDTLIYLLLTGQMKERAIVFSASGLTELPSLPLDGTEVTISPGVAVTAQDSNGRLSLANIDSSALRRLAANESDSATAAVFVDSLLDWTDRDDLARVNGAEAAYYLNSGLPWTPRNYGIQYLDEIALIRGTGGGLKERLAPSLTIMPNTGFNPNTAGTAALKAVLDISDGTAARVREYAAQRPIRTVADLFRLTGRSYEAEGRSGWFFPSGYLDIVISAGGPRSLCRIKAGLSTGQGIFYPYFIHYWQEE